MFKIYNVTYVHENDQKELPKKYIFKRPSKSVIYEDIDFFSEAYFL